MNTPTGRDQRLPGHPQLYIRDSSDEDLPEIEKFNSSTKGRRKRAYNTFNGQPSSVGRHLIKEETTPPRANGPSNSIKDLLACPPNSRFEKIDDDSESEPDVAPAGERRTPCQRPTGFRPGYSMRDRFPHKHGGDIYTDIIEDAEEGACDTIEKDSPVPNLQTQGPKSGTAKKYPEAVLSGQNNQNASQATPGMQHIVSGVGDPMFSGQRSFLASHLPALAQNSVPTSARRPTTRKGTLLARRLSRVFERLSLDRYM